MNAATATQAPALPAAPAAPIGRQYWAVHLKLVDNIIPMASYDAATMWAEKTNAEWEMQNRGKGDAQPMNAVVIQSPWTAEEHFQRCAGLLSNVLQEGDRLIAHMQGINNMLAGVIKDLQPDAERYRFHRALTLDLERQSKLENLVLEQEELADPTDDASYDASMDKLRDIATTAGLWPLAPAQPAQPATPAQVAA